VPGSPVSRFGLVALWSRCGLLAQRSPVWLRFAPGLVATVARFARIALVPGQVAQRTGHAVVARSRSCPVALPLVPARPREGLILNCANSVISLSLAVVVPVVMLGYFA
jgi:hypothetical protein